MVWPITEVSFELVSVQGEICYYSNFRIENPQKKGLYVYDVESKDEYGQTVITGIRPYGQSRNFGGCILSKEPLTPKSMNRVLGHRRNGEFYILSDDDIILEEEMI